jgi:hypothetical protein
MNTNKKGEIDLSEGDVFNLHSSNKLLTFTESVNNICLEIRSLQGSIALMKQEFPKIILDELFRLKKKEY